MTRHSGKILISLMFLLLWNSVFLTAQPMDLERIVDRSIVGIRSYDKHGNVIGTGSGFFVRTGHVITNWHVVDSGVSTEIVMQSGISTWIELINYYPELDIAFLTPSSTLKSARYLNVSPDDVYLGLPVYAIGGPRNLMFTVSEGIVSNRNRMMHGQRFYQFTASISPGSSGGPIIDPEGRVVGIVTSQYPDGQNLNFAIPSSTLHPLLSEMDQIARIASVGGERLGPETETLTEDPEPDDRQAVLHEGSDQPETEATDAGAKHVVRTTAGERLFESLSVELLMVTMEASAGLGLTADSGAVGVRLVGMDVGFSYVTDSTLYGGVFGSYYSGLRPIVVVGPKVMAGRPDWTSVGIGVGASPLRARLSFIPVVFLQFQWIHVSIFHTNWAWRLFDDVRDQGLYVSLGYTFKLR